jgi:hypothetical protein
MLLLELQCLPIQAFLTHFLCVYLCGAVDYARLRGELLPRPQLLVLLPATRLALTSIAVDQRVSFIERMITNAVRFACLVMVATAHMV